MIIEHLVEKEIVSKDAIPSTMNVIELKRLEPHDKEKEHEPQLKMKEMELQEQEFALQLRLKELEIAAASKAPPVLTSRQAEFEFDVTKQVQFSRRHRLINISCILRKLRQVCRGLNKFGHYSFRALC